MHRLDQQSDGRCPGAVIFMCGVGYTRGGCGSVRENVNRKCVVAFLYLLCWATELCSKNPTPRLWWGTFTTAVFEMSL